VGERAVKEPLRLRGGVGLDPRHPQARGHPLGERREAFAGRPVEQVVAVEMEAVEDEERERNGPTELFDAEPATEPAHRHLEWARAVVPVERDHLAVQDGRLHRELPQRIDELGNSTGHVGEVAGEGADVVAAAVKLQPGAVELPLERGRTNPRERILEVVGRLGEHRLERAKQRQPEALERLPASRRGGGRDGAEVGDHHQRAPNIRGRDLGRPRDRLDHHAGERSLAELPREERDEESLLVFGRAREEVLQLLPPELLRPPPRGIANPPQGRVYVEQLERRPGRRRSGQLAKRGPADADRPVQELPREVGDGDGHLRGVEAPDTRGQQLDLAQASLRARDVGRRPCELVEQHG
jgi:hypothetical protein